MLDVANPLDFSQGMPPVLSVANTDSLRGAAQAAFPDARVVKTLNTMNAYVMVDPARLPGRHNVFVAGEDTAAKETVKELLREFGWPDEAIVDLGGIRAAQKGSGDVPAAVALDLGRAGYRRLQHRHRESLTSTWQPSPPSARTSSAASESSTRPSGSSMPTACAASASMP